MIAVTQIDWTPVAVILVGGIVAIPGGWAALRQRRTEDGQRRRENALTEHKDLIDTMQEELARLRATVTASDLEAEKIRARHLVLQDDFDKLRTQLADWAHGIQLLVVQIRALGAVPVWLPEQHRITPPDKE